ncbi:MAG: hypothetical protein ABR956_00905 [Terracidiphilus sp.]
MLSKGKGQDGDVVVLSKLLGSVQNLLRIAWPAEDSLRQPSAAA